ncbi:hypothetical protein C9374_004755 [Naegleria lovaniensis]|uniref:SDH assembly factor 2 n=1 Tax=Naegleria lovaniensis TaxID=51637 RepID=A0AA88KKB5_NAELO|nr:uncharacterized protein C9374_004755 [Naegleria lovaniensis]KAG2382788.1 hypothetical protein C9374_004755 [Naegleria lovaniensis]
MNKFGLTLFKRVSCIRQGLQILPARNGSSSSLIVMINGHHHPFHHQVQSTRYFSTSPSRFSDLKNQQEDDEASEAVSETAESHLTDEEIIKSIPDFRPPYFHEILAKANKDGKALNEMTKQEQENFMNNIKRRILMYCRNRGRVETELFLGGFAREHIPSMNDWKELEEFYDLLCEHDSDLYNWLIATEQDKKSAEWKEKLPERWRDSEIMQRVMNYVDSKRAIKYYETTEQQRSLRGTRLNSTSESNATFNEDYDATDSGEMIRK